MGGRTKVWKWKYIVYTVSLAIIFADETKYGFQYSHWRIYTLL